ncbi:MAG: carboxypeptidase regulatory-like domain-containing protein [Planctomycetes bacterium]|nr:carboxypeptidase regulatory-like domain-containing protein [Planctomycetota bacterium]
MTSTFRRLRVVLFAFACTTVLGASAEAQTFLDGIVVDQFGAPAPFVNLDIKNIGGGGGTPNVANDGTDATGHFHMTILTTATGTYEVSFIPPQPPASTAQVTVVSSVTVPGNTTVNLGTVQLTAGFSISGHVQNSVGGAVAGLNFDVIDSGGSNVTLVYDQSDAFGNFSFASPGGPITLRFITTPVVGQTLASIEMPLDLTNDTNLGTVTLQQGYSVSTIVRNPSNIGINNVDLDVIDVATGVKLFTPNDNTNATGLVTVVVPAGNYFFDYFPPVATHLAPARFPATIAANSSNGIVICPLGYFLSGTVRNPANAPVLNANIDLRDSATNADIPLANDATNAAGTYAVLVPAGTFNVKFRPGPNTQFSEDIAYNTVIAADTVVNGTLHGGYLPSCFGDGTTATPCPCSNFGAPGRGCANSANPSGALLTADGAVVVNPNTGVETLVLHVSGTPNILSTAAIFLQGDAYNAAGSTFGDGVLCLSGALIRIGSKPLPGGIAQFPDVGNLAISQRGAVVPGSGTLRWYATYYRNSAAAFCPPSTFNATNTLQVTW